MKSWLNTPIGSPRGKLMVLGTLVLLVAIVIGFIAADASRSTKQSIAAATAPWDERSTIKMFLTSPESSHVEIAIESGLQLENVVLEATQTLKGEEDSVAAISRSKTFTLPEGRTNFTLPLEPGWVKVRVALRYLRRDRPLIEAEITREGQ